jgi:hypothetical protein
VIFVFESLGKVGENFWQSNTRVEGVRRSEKWLDIYRHRCNRVALEMWHDTIEIVTVKKFK